MTDLNNALVLMGVGMAGIFMVMLIIMLIVKLLTRISK